ncbi:NFATC2-interacting protein [Actinidia chinensis var. chinensis]|uniref:NFATC2-interacting protein n=1 Tax=Actinidia chinensis var. chinensis TaxID=1590841 RepID=A0A2R6QQP3_ACTCC|nr:NFATC2-interacting protein [Actinidia chinensis var. chinensis]
MTLEQRLKKQELTSFAKSADELLRSVEQTTKIDFNTSLQSTIESAADQSTKPLCERAKIVISIQEKEGLKQFRVYKDDKLERLFKMNADKSNLDLQSLVFVLMEIKLVQQQFLMALGWRAMTLLKCTSNRNDQVLASSMALNLTSLHMGAPFGYFVELFSTLLLNSFLMFQQVKKFDLKRYSFCAVFG